MDPLRCLQAVGSKVRQVDQLYPDGAAQGNLWETPGATPLCSSVSPPPPSGCLVCFQETAYAVCNNVTSDLIMEGDGITIPIRESGCPVFMEPASSEDLWWLIFIPFIIIIIIGVLVYRKRKGIYRPSRNAERRNPTLLQSET